MITILGSGQSNALGWGDGGAWPFPMTGPSVTVWNCAGNTNTGAVGNAFVAPTFGAAPFSAGHNNMMIHACRYLAAELGQNVRLVLVAMGSQPISEWVAGSAAMYARMQAVLAAAGVTCVDAFLWHQGESGIDEASWDILVAKMIADGYIDDDTPIVVGELTIDHPSQNVVLQSIADASPRVRIAAIGCFLAVVPHYTGPSLVRAGLEYARELMKFDEFEIDCEPDEHAYVTAAGYEAYTSTSGNWAKIPVKAENGKRSLIDAGGFKADRLGVWEFDVSGYTYKSSVNVALLDGNGDVLQMLIGLTAANNSPHFDGSSVIALGKDDRVYMAVMQTSGTSATVAAVGSALVNRMTVKYLGRD